MRSAGSSALLRAGILLVSLGLGAAGAKGDVPNSLEMAVKAAFLYKFQPFVAWPDGAFPSPTAPFTLCVVGKNPFGALLDRVVDGQRVGDRDVVVRPIATVSPGDHCQILYVGADDPAVAEKLQEPVAGTPVLTVTDGINDPAAKGIINFVIVDDSVHFEIDDAAARKSGLVISSRLLSLAIRPN